MFVKSIHLRIRLSGFVKPFTEAEMDNCENSATIIEKFSD